MLGLITSKAKMQNFELILRVLIFHIESHFYKYIDIEFKLSKDQLKDNLIISSYYKFDSLQMNIEKDKQVDQLLKHIHQANSIIGQWAECFGEKLIELMGQQQLIDIGSLAFQKFQEQTNAELPIDRPSFFSQIPNINIEQQTEQKIMNFKLNFVSARRKDQLFKRHRKQQQEKLTLRKKQMQKYYCYKMDNLRNIKGEFTLKKGDQLHTCSITGDDLQKLKPQTDLNDTIIGNYLKYLQTQVFSEELDKNIFVYSSFFIQKLIGEMLREDVNMNQKNIEFLYDKMKMKVAQNYKNIKRWTRRVDIFQKQFLVIPINAFKHWYCIIVVNPGSLLEPNSDKRPYIANCDSMFEKRPFIIDAIRMYLQVELQDKKSKKIEITQLNFPSFQLLLPRQTNTHDCGLYMLTYIEHLLLNPKQLYNLEEIKGRQKLHLFPRNLIYSMRQRLKQLFISLIQNTDENIRKDILKKYKQVTQEMTTRADEQDFDKINQKEFGKYQTMNSYLLQSSGFNGAELTKDQLEYACKVRFYLDPEINYYQRDKPFLM